MINEKVEDKVLCPKCYYNLFKYLVVVFFSLENEEEQVFDDWLFLYFLLLPSRSGSPLSSVVAQVLLSPHEINRSVLPIVEDHILAQKSVTERSRNHSRREVVPCDELVLDQVVFYDDDVTLK